MVIFILKIKKNVLPRMGSKVLDEILRHFLTLKLSWTKW